GFNKLDLIGNLLPVYDRVLTKLKEAGATYIQIDEPCLVLDLTDKERALFEQVYAELKNRFPDLHIILAAYFDCYDKNLKTAISLPVDTLHVDLARCPKQLDSILEAGIGNKNLSLGVVDGRNIWKND